MQPTHRLGPLRHSGRIEFGSYEEQQSYFEMLGFSEVPSGGPIRRMYARGVDDDGSELVMFMDRVRDLPGLGWNFSDYGRARSTDATA